MIYELLKVGRSIYEGFVKPQLQGYVLMTCIWALSSRSRLFLPLLVVWEFIKGWEWEGGEPAGLAGLCGDGGGPDPHVGGDDHQRGPLLRFSSLRALGQLLLHEARVPLTGFLLPASLRDSRVRRRECPGVDPSPAADEKFLVSHFFAHCHGAWCVHVEGQPLDICGMSRQDGKPLLFCRKRLLGSPRFFAVWDSVLLSARKIRKGALAHNLPQKN